MFKGIRGIRGRILYTYLFLILISMAVVGISLIWMLQNYLLANLEENMVNQARLVSGFVEDQVRLEKYDELSDKVNSMEKDLHVRITIVLKNGQVIADSQFDPRSMENHGYRSEIRQALEEQVGVYVRRSTTSEVETMYVAVPIKYQDEVLGAARISLPLEEIKSTFLKLRGLLLTGILIATFIAVLLSIKLANGLTEPIQRISIGARRIAEGDFTTRIFTGTRDEIEELGSAINEMTKTLQQHIEEISQEKSRLENILYTMASGVIMLDQYGLVRIVNPAAEEIFGISTLTAEGKHNLEVIRHFGLNQEIEKCITQEKIIDYEFSIRFPEERVLQCYVAPVYRDKRIAGITLVFHDITNLRKVEQMRADFVANASHELRTPLTVIKGYVETLLNGALDDREVSEKFVSIIDQEAERLKRLVDELLTLSQLESNPQEATQQPVDIIEIIKLVRDEMRPRFMEREMTVKMDLPEDILLVKANHDKVKQVLVNLLDNGVKYTPQGGSISISLLDLDSKIKIMVKDTGIGIPQKYLPRIFERFYRVDKARSRQMGGFGLGLSIVKHIVENMGGTIGVESVVGKGSTFWFTLPKA
ncbi:MAG: phosphate regulon sensor histidine kinase PhoR [Dehalobacterium sp.]